jgi:hypothetical protein
MKAMAAQEPATDLEAYLAALDHPRKTEIEQLVALALGASPGITGHVKWNAPSFCIGGDDRVTLRLNPPPTLQVIFHRGARAKEAADFRFTDESGLLQMVALDRGVVKLGEGDVAVHADALERLIARWVEATA